MLRSYFLMLLIVNIIKIIILRGLVKNRATFQKRHIYFKYTETKLILLFNVIPLDFNAPVPAFHMFFFFNFVRKEVVWLHL
jgi:hypothetical protein